ncbi:MAG: hypothetical protein PHN78_06750, partial [Dehalococcoidales bacterium]|nr:hypothetical protein [Dehalococcoidales bacterium]
MPLVRIRHIPLFPAEDIKKLARALPGIVAEALTCSNKGGELRVGDIEVEITPTELGDIIHHEISIIIDANYFPHRANTLEERVRKIEEELKPFWPRGCHFNACICVRLFPAASVSM